MVTPFEQSSHRSRRLPRLTGVLVLVVAVLLFTREGWSQEVTPTQSPVERTANILAAQLLLDTSIAVASSPSSREHEHWAKSPGWSTDQRCFSLVAATHLTPALIETAVQHWAALNPTASEADRARVLADLKRRFLKDGQRAFLMQFLPIQATNYSNEWRVCFGPLATHVTLTSLGGKPGKATLTEDSPANDRLSFTTPWTSTLIWIQDVSAPDDPVFTLRLDGISYWIRDNNNTWAKGKDGSPDPWILTKSPTTLRFRFETETAKLASLLEARTPWDDIKKRYLAPRLDAAKSSALDSAAVGNFLAGLVHNVLSGMLLKLIGI